MFEGFQVKGNARTVFSRGEVIVETAATSSAASAGRGQYLRRAARAAAAWTLASRRLELHTATMLAV